MLPNIQYLRLYVVTHSVFAENMLSLSWLLFYITNSLTWLLMQPSIFHLNFCGRKGRLADK